MNFLLGQSLRLSLQSSKEQLKHTTSAAGKVVIAKRPLFENWIYVQLISI